MVSWSEHPAWSEFVGFQTNTEKKKKEASDKAKTKSLKNHCKNLDVTLT